MPIPGYKELLEKDHHEEGENNDNILFLLMGPGGCGKTLYCKTFFQSRLKTGSIGIFLSSKLTKRRYKNLFNGLSNIIDSNSFFINPFLREQTDPNELNNSELNNSLFNIKKEIDKIIFSLKLEHNNQHIDEKNKEITFPPFQQKRICMVIDSLSHLFNIFDEKDVLRFINALSFSLKNNNVLSIFTIDDTVVEQSIIDKIRPIFDGVLQIKIHEKEDEIVRQIKF